MSKYIVKNCPAYENGKCWNPNSKHECCSKNDDCITKRTIDLIQLGKKECTCLLSSESCIIAKIIYNSLDLQEVK